MPDRGPTLPIALRRIAVAMLLAIHIGLAFTSIGQKCTTFDEYAHIAAGYTYWRFGDYRLDPDAGQWSNRLAGLGLIGAGFQAPEFLPGERMWGYGERFFYESGNDPQAILTRARSGFILLSAITGLLVYLWASRVFGQWGGLLALSTYCFSPTILAYGRLANPDLPVAFALLVAVTALWVLMHKANWPTLLLSVLATSAAALVKFSGLIIVPIAAVMVVAALTANRPMRVQLPGVWRGRVTGRVKRAGVLVTLALAHVAFVFGMVWASHDWQYTMARDLEPGSHYHPMWDDMLDHDGTLLRLIEFAREHRLLPEAYLFGLAYVKNTTVERGSFMNGAYSVYGWPSFFPFAFAVKTPVTILAMFALGAIAIGLAPGRRRVLYRLTPLLALFGVYWAVVITSGLNIGVRHLLPVYPVVFVIIGAVATWAFRFRWLAGGLGVGVALLVIENLWVHPHYLAYFNPLAGGPSQGYRRLADSSLDWGQDLPSLAKWLDAHHDGAHHDGSEPVYLHYFGNGDPPSYGIDARRLPGMGHTVRRERPAPLEPGLYCISATLLQAVYGKAMGPWCSLYEKTYQDAKLAAEQFMATDGDLEARKTLLDQAGLDFWRRAILDYQALRAARLCAMLRQREPIAKVGYTIFVYRLNEDDVWRAEHGPPAEEYPTVQVDGLRFKTSEDDT